MFTTIELKGMISFRKLRLLAGVDALADCCGPAQELGLCLRV